MKNAVWLGLALIPSIALAGTPPEKQDKKRDGLICRDVAQTGSRLDTRRVCMTKEEWEDTRTQARQNIERMQNTRAYNGT